ncbi:twitching motility protein PilT [Clostridium novyi A str. 4552]|uniref:Twitching motility protein PilT n=1 Tax=Clostridium novyi A str. 4552 TaxID=1444289 RepID=A0A0A0I467_CLONO|nr:type IV pilus twitching motility protein PilT [Clostridium novyi]KGM96164.1 twitching motility protein PilT [Clostridium novyi A str. 4552]
MILLNELLHKTVDEKASDLHLTVGISPILRVNGELVKIGEEKLTATDTKKYAKEILGDKFEEYDNIGEIDTSISIPSVGRFRVNVYKQRGSHALAIRAVALKIPTISQLKLPPIIKELSNKHRGLILVTGPTGSGKSTTLASIINEINTTRSAHVITLEDPIEFLHKHNKSIINQREIGNDTPSYTHALRAVLREDPDVILVGEMRDLETIGTAITAAETGHLVLSTLHTIGAAKTIDRIIDVFPPHQQQQIKIQLSNVLQGVISQQLIPRYDEKGQVASFEIMVLNSAIQNLIREGKTHQIQSLIQTGSKYGMKTTDMSIVDLYRNKMISYENALTYSVDKSMVKRMIDM